MTQISSSILEETRVRGVLAPGRNIACRVRVGSAANLILNCPEMIPLIFHAKTVQSWTGKMLFFFTSEPRDCFYAIYMIVQMSSSVS